jgi:AraC-like DNA-binding protein
LFNIFDILCNSHEYEFLASPAFVEQKDVETSSRFERVNTYIMKNFDQVITLKEIAAVANMAICTFCNFFKEQYRVTFVEYLNLIRIGHACMLLTDSDLSVADIAYKCGFNNIANFNRQFRKLKNMTPSEYRRVLNLRIAV